MVKRVIFIKEKEFEAPFHLVHPVEEETKRSRSRRGDGEKRIVLVREMGVDVFSRHVGHGPKVIRKPAIHEESLEFMKNIGIGSKILLHVLDGIRAAHEFVAAEGAKP